MATRPDSGHSDFMFCSALVFMATLLRSDFAFWAFLLEGRSTAITSGPHCGGGYWISIPLTRELSFTVVNWITYWPLALAFAVNCSMIALFLAPAAAKISKLLNTCVPLMLTLKIREPAADQKVSAKCSRTVWLAPAVNPGMV